MSTVEEGSSRYWHSNRGYMWALLGSAVGFANLLCFSAHCYKNGGGAFLIPLVIAYTLLGIPMLMLESIIGQKLKLPFVSAFGKEWGSPAKVIGWLSALGCMTIGAFYMVLTGFSVAYTYFSIADLIPADTALFFKSSFLHDSGSLTTWGSLSLPIAGSTLLIAAATLFFMTRGIQKGIERVCSIFMPILISLICIFVIITLFLPGAMEGVRRFLTPDFSHLLNFSLWRDVFGQLFFSLSLGLGIITGYARYSNQTINMRQAMFWVAIGDLFIAFISGLVIFACIGYMSYTTETPFDQIVKSDSTFEMGFVIFPKVLHTFGSLKSIIGALFFGCLIFKGLTGVFSIIESISGNIEEEFRISRNASIMIALGISTMLALLFCMGNGQHLLGAIAPMVLGINMLIVAILTIVYFVLCNLTIRQEMTLQLGWNSEAKVKMIGLWMLAVLIVILGGVLQNEIAEAGSLPMVIRWSWFGVALLLASGLSWISRSNQPALASQAILEET